MGSRPQTIGPYSLDKRLGAGGMGEVYQAYDARLDRWVAIKLIRPESSEDSTTRERFRREARAAARLSHSAIVQIHDIVETDEGDAIVMELVEGESLASRIQRGPLPAGEAVRLGYEIAEGLAAAHASGIVHRDLKTDNVMVSADGHAKILDFGLAKRLEGETSLTGDHRVVGTLRSMSPEQARGLPLDHRSDLFSFGVLLYEMLTGRSPFDGGSAMETLTRVCTHRQMSLRELRSGIPEDFSNLVDHLLNKDPTLRPRSAREVMMALRDMERPSAPVFDPQETQIESPLSTAPPKPVAVPPSVASRELSSRAWTLNRGRRWGPVAVAVVLLVLGVLFASRSFLLSTAESLYVAVPKPEVSVAKGAVGVDLLASSLRLSLLQGLLSLDGIVTLAPDQVDETSGSARDIAQAMAASEVVSSRLVCAAEICQVSLSRLRGRDGTLLWTETFEAPIDQPYLLAEAVASRLRQGYAGHRPRRDSHRLEVRKEDYNEYLRLRREFDSKRENLPVAEILDRVARLRISSPRFVEACIFESDVLRYRFVARRSPADLERAFAVLARARDLAPSDPRPLSSLFETALTGERLNQAEEALRILERLQPGEPEVFIQRARLLERRGNSTAALALMRQATERRPSWKNLIRLADMEYRLGESAAARQHLLELLQRLPRHYQARSLLAQIELVHGSPQRAAEIYEALVQRSPQMPEMTNLGVAYMLLRRYSKARKVFEQVLLRDPENPLLILNLADVFLLAGKREEAEALYLRLLDLVDRDPARGSWQLLSIRAQALAHLGRRREAVEAAQQALLLAPKNAQAAQEVSLVYTLVGDQASALANAGRALRQGVEPIWFSFPWFDPLRASPEFREMLRSAVRSNPQDS